MAILIEALRALLTAGDLRAAGAISDDIRQTLEFLGDRMEVDEALTLLHGVKPVLFTALKDATGTGSDAASSDGIGEDIRMATALADILGFMPINIFLALAKRVQSITAELLAETVDQIRWLEPGAIYESDLPRSVIPDLEGLAVRLEMERSIEGDIISPQWYRRQLVTASFVRAINAALDKLIEEQELFYVREAESLLAEGRVVIAAQVIQNGIEACAKFVHHIKAMQKVVGNWATLRRVSKLAWLDIDWDGLNRRSNVVRRQLLEAYGRAAAALASLPAGPSLPDYFGQAYALLAEETYATAADGDIEAFSKAFKALFDATFLAYDRARQHLQARGVDDTDAFLIGTEPLMTLLNLSGYALIYSELDSSGCWTTATSIWNNFLASRADRREVVAALYAIANGRASWFGIITAGIDRTKWQQDLARTLRERGIPDEEPLPSHLQGQTDGDDAPAHPSAVIRALTRGGYTLGPYNDGCDVFFAAYLCERPEAEGMALPPRAKDFRAALMKERSGGRRRSRRIRSSSPRPPAQVDSRERGTRDDEARERRPTDGTTGSRSDGAVS